MRERKREKAAKERVGLQKQNKKLIDAPTLFFLLVLSSSCDFLVPFFVAFFLLLQHALIHKKSNRKRRMERVEESVQFLSLAEELTEQVIFCVSF